MAIRRLLYALLPAGDARLPILRQQYADLAAEGALLLGQVHPSRPARPGGKPAPDGRANRDARAAPYRKRPPTQPAATP